MGDSPPWIVVLDDAPELRALFEALLTGEGYRVVTVSDLAGLAAVLATARPQLIIGDALLAGLPPFAALDWLQAAPAAAGIPCCCVPVRCGR